MGAWPALVQRAPMPLYYFNLFNDEVTMDDEGLELADAGAARAHAVKEARAMAADTVRHGHLTASHHIDFVDEDRNPVGSVRFDEAVEIRH
jgi:hypothetical protein